MQKVLSMNTYRSSAMTYRAYLAFKRLFDIIASLCGIVALLPLLLVVAAVVAVDTKGNPIFVQYRVGRNNQRFRIYKFHTMSSAAPSDVATCQLADSDKYISKIGRFLRRCSIDELPQLFNILRGEMSVVGPRPVVQTETELIELRTRNGVCAVRPGLTGLAQTSGRDLLSIQEKARMDAFYANNMSLLTDLRILWRSVGYVLRARDICEGSQLHKKNSDKKSDKKQDVQSA